MAYGCSWLWGGGSCHHGRGWSVLHGRWGLAGTLQQGGVAGGGAELALRGCVWVGVLRVEVVVVMVVVGGGEVLVMLLRLDVSRGGERGGLGGVVRGVVRGTMRGDVRRIVGGDIVRVPTHSHSHWLRSMHTAGRLPPLAVV